MAEEETVVEETSFSGDVNEQVEEQLPSEVEEKKSFVPEDIDDFIEKNLSENGKLFGQFDNVADALEYYRKQEIAHTNRMRDLANEKKAKEEEVQSIQADLELTQKQNEVIESLIPKFLENGMELDEEMLLAVKEAGMDERDIRLKAYEVKENANKMKDIAYKAVGSEEEYNAMMAWANENLDEAAKNDFDKSIQGMYNNPAIGEFAIKGLYATYKQGAEPITQQERLTGTSVPTDKVGGYTSQEELFRDRKASESSPALREKYLKRLAMTDERLLSLRPI